MQFKTLALAALASTAAAQTQMSLTQTLSNASDLSSLNALLNQYPDFSAQLELLTNVTVLAPSNNAIAAFLNSSSAGAANNTALIQAILSYHVLNGTAPLTNMTRFVPTQLMPPTYANVTGGQRVELHNNTVYSGLNTNSTLNGTGMNFTGGVLYTIDRLLTVPQNVTDTASAYNLTSAVGAITALNLTQTVDNTRDVTIFLPNNAAFQAVGGNLANMSTQELTSILSYHVVAGTVAYSTDLSNTSIASSSGQNLTITVFNSTSVFVNDARVVLPNVLVANGVVHVIDAVLSPNATQVAMGDSPSGSAAFPSASSASDVPYTSNVPAPRTTIITSEIVATATGGAGATSSGAAWSPKATGAVQAVLAGGLLAALL